MFKCRVILLCLGVMIFSARASAKKIYDRAMVWTGGGLNIPLFFGEYDAALKAGRKPDLLIGTCGASLAAIVIGAYPEIEDRQHLLYESDSIYQILKLGHVNAGRNDSWEIVTHAQSLIFPELFGRRHEVPNIFVEGILDVPMDVPTSSPFLSQLVNEPYTRASPRVLTVAGEVLYESSRVGEYTEPQSRLFRETYITDNKTAEHLEGLPSPVSGSLTRSESEWGSVVDEKTQTLTTLGLLKGSRLAITDPYFVSGAFLNEKHYLGSTINLYPIELALHLAENVDFTYHAPIDSVVDRGFKRIFRYSMFERGARVLATDGIDHWIDHSDINLFNKTHGFDPLVTPMGVHLIMDRIPNSLEDFRQKAKIQYDWGMSRASEAFKQSSGSKNHIRKPQSE